MATSEGYTVGIDLGTSNTCVAYARDGKPVVLADEQGSKIHPSVVYFRADGKVAVGKAAKRFILADPKRTVYSAKRLIGRFCFSDEVRRAKLRYGYSIVEGANNSVRIDVGGRLLTPQDVAAFIIKKMKRIAEQELGGPVTSAVVTVPAYFNDNQRQATRDACEIAGLEVLRIINEPTAAAVAYGYGQDYTKRIAVYDLGGGTFDVSILEIGRDIYEVLSTAGDTYLGGDDFDDRIVTFLTKEYFSSSGIDLREDARTMPALLNAAEHGKRKLSEQPEVEILIRNLTRDADGRSHDLRATLTENALAKMTLDLLQRTFKVCDEALQGAKLVASDLEGVIFVGGPTRLPFIRKAVAHYFQRDPESGVDPDEVVALGAALQAHGLRHGGEASPTLLDVTPLTLRIGTVGGYSVPIIDRNTPVPIERSRKFTTVRDGQERVDVMVLQGESNKQDECERLGQFEFSGFRVAPRGAVEIDVAFEIDGDGIVHVSATDTETGRQASTTITLSSGLSRPDIAAGRRRTQSIEFDEETALLEMPS